MTNDQSSGMHVAIIMDGNGRWAHERNLPRTAGHKKGATSVRSIIESAPDLGISTLTLYAFSSDNWKRPEEEVSALMSLFRTYLKKERKRCVREGVRVNVVGRRDRLPRNLIRTMIETERATKPGDVMNLRLAVDYSARDLMLSAAQRLAANGNMDRDSFARAIGEVMNEPQASPDVDLLIRTGGEQRLSDFLLWECAYAELYFVEKRWPDFGKEDLAQAVAWFQRRDRRFGKVPAASLSPGRVRTLRPVPS